MNKHEANVKLADLVIRPDMKGYTAASFSARLDRFATGPGKGGGTATMVRDHAGKRIDRGVRECGQRDPESQSTGKIAIRNIIIRGLSPRRKDGCAGRCG